MPDNGLSEAELSSRYSQQQSPGACTISVLNIMLLSIVLCVIMLFLSVGLAFACDASRIWTDHLVATLHYIASRGEVYFKLYVHIKSQR